MQGFQAAKDQLRRLSHIHAQVSISRTIAAFSFSRRIGHTVYPSGHTQIILGQYLVTSLLSSLDSLSLFLTFIFLVHLSLFYWVEAWLLSFHCCYYYSLYLVRSHRVQSVMTDRLRFFSGSVIVCVGLCACIWYSPLVHEHGLP